MATSRCPARHSGTRKVPRRQNGRPPSDSPGGRFAEADGVYLPFSVISLDHLIFEYVQRFAGITDHDILPQSSIAGFAVQKPDLRVAPYHRIAVAHHRAEALGRAEQGFYGRTRIGECSRKIILQKSIKLTLNDRFDRILVRTRGDTQAGQGGNYI